nr:EAL domain-containing protein [uncultured Desulfuromonas sp.]
MKKTFRLITSKGFLPGLVILWMIAGFILFQYLYQQQEVNNKQDLSHLQRTLENDFSHIQSALQGLNQLYLQSDHPNPFMLEVATRFIPKSECYQVMGVAPYVDASMAAELIDSFRLQGFENLSISDFGQQAMPLPKKAPVLYLTPLDPSNAQLMAKDLLTLIDLQNIYDKLMSHCISCAYKTAFYDNQKQLFLVRPLQSSSEANVSFGLVFVRVDLQEFLLRHVNFNNYQLQVHYRDRLAFNCQVGDACDWFRIRAAIEHRPTEITLAFSFPFSMTPLQKVLAAVLLLVIGVIYALLFKYYLQQVDYHRNMRLNQRRYNELVENALEGIMEFDPQGCLRRVNPVAEKILNTSFARMRGLNITDIFIEHNFVEEQRRLVDIVNQKIDFEPLYFDTEILTLSAEKKCCRMTLIQLELWDQTETVLFIEDITEARSNQKKIENLAYFDELTKLESRHYMRTNVLRQIESYPEQSIQLMFSDLDGFKKINDALGHNVGDKVLQAVAERFQDILKNTICPKHLCRFGGDEFVIVLFDIEQDKALEYAKKILIEIGSPINVDNYELVISASIGLAQYPQDGDNINTLLRRADAAMYQAKLEGKNTYAFYSSEMEQKLSYLLKVEMNLLNALKQSVFKLHYQPKVNSETGEVLGVEALIRWHDDELGQVPPPLLIQVAEETGHINALGDWVVKEAIRQLQAWQGTAFEDLTIAVNVSSYQLLSSKFLDRVMTLCEFYSVNPEKIEIELTESAIMQHADENIELFFSIRKSGILLSIDDFGTGYSSLNYLKRFPISTLKLDKSFVDGLPDDPDDRMLCQTIINLAHNLQMNVVAEGVENKAQRDYLRAIGCDVFQGYLYSRPLSSTEFEDWSMNWKKYKTSSV